MMQSLLSLVLVMTQLLSWSASPLYLCFDDDGSVCIDLGPDECGCCKHSPADDECVSVDGSCEDHDHSDSAKLATALEGSFGASPCDCTHIQISQSPMLVRSSTSPDAQRLVVFFATITCDLYSYVAVPPIDEAPTLFQTLNAPSLSLIAMASIIMRC